MDKPVKAKVTANIPTDCSVTLDVVLCQELQAGPPADRLDVETGSALWSRSKDRCRNAEAPDTWTMAGIGPKCLVEPLRAKEGRQISNCTLPCVLALIGQVVRAVRVAKPEFPVDLPLSTIDRQPCILVQLVHRNIMSASTDKSRSL
jgi:hypothetical protein